MKILVIHGPNLNLFGLWSAKHNKKITLNKINSSIRKYSNNKDINLKIIQTHNETKIVSYIQNNRNRIDGIIITPGPWQYSGYVLSELLDLIDIPFITITYKVREHIKLLNGFENLVDDNLIRALEDAIDLILKKNDTKAK
jgi:3-dehydroquinate dehydratase-2